MGYIPSTDIFDNKKEEEEEIFIPEHESCDANSANSSLPPCSGNNEFGVIISDQFTVKRTFGYSDPNRDCSLQILEQSFDDCVQHVCIKYSDNVHDDKAQADIVITIDGTGEALSCKMIGISNNLAWWKHRKNNWGEVVEDAYVGCCHRPQGYSVFGCTSRRKKHQNRATVEHYYNKEANEYHHVRVDVELEKQLVTRVSETLKKKQMTGRPAVAYSKFQRGDPANEHEPLSGRRACVGEPKPHPPSYYNNNGPQEMNGLANSSGFTMGMGNNSVYYNNCNFY